MCCQYAIRTHFKVVRRIGGRSQAQIGRVGNIFPYEAAGLKDVVWLGPGETVTVEAYYAPWDGIYMFHCHNMIHEDHEMMAAFNVSVLTDLGYNETNYYYIDPMEPLWRPRPIVPADFTDAAIKARVEFLASFEPYNRVAEVSSVLSAYWATKTASSAASGVATATATSSPSPSVPPGNGIYRGKAGGKSKLSGWSFG
jgi:bilirubin oxidase